MISERVKILRERSETKGANLPYPGGEGADPDKVRVGFCCLLCFPLFFYVFYLFLEGGWRPIRENRNMCFQGIIPDVISERVFEN